MGQLRKRYNDEAPLLFLAASPKSSELCFTNVSNHIAKKLGLGGLLEQINSTDRFGRTLRMHAARSRNDSLYDKVDKLLETPDGKKWYIEEKISEPDYRGCSLLHHAAEAGSPYILEKVVEAMKNDPNCSECFNSSDNFGRTPLMSILSQRLKTKEDYDDRQTKLEILRKATQGLDWSMAIVYAARGGLHSFIMTLTRMMEDKKKKAGSFLQSVSDIVKENAEKYKQRSPRLSVQRVSDIAKEDDEVLPDHTPDQHKQLVKDVKEAMVVCLKKEHMDSLLVQAALGGRTSLLDLIFEVRRKSSMMGPGVIRSSFTIYRETVSRNHLICLRRSAHESHP